MAERGYRVTHGHCEAYTSGKGNLAGQPGEALRFVTIGAGLRIRKYSFGRRLLQEFRLGVELANLFRRQRPDVVLIANTPIPALLVVAVWFTLRRTPWVLWQQDVFAAAVESFAAANGSAAFRLGARLYGAAEAFCARRATHIIVIAEAFRTIHQRWGTTAKTTVIANWAPIDEVTPRARDNSWAQEQGIDGGLTLLYAGTLGLKHNPRLLVLLAAEIRRRGTEVRLVTVNEGPAVDVLRTQAIEHHVPVKLLPFQPYDRLPDVLGAGDVLLVLLEPDASTFSVPSKAWTYFCAGRPVLAFLPEANAATDLIGRAGGMVVAPTEAAVSAAADWVIEIWDDTERRCRIGRTARALAEEEFSPERTVARFERILLDTAAGRSDRSAVGQ